MKWSQNHKAAYLFTSMLAHSNKFARVPNSTTSSICPCSCCSLLAMCILGHCLLLQTLQQNTLFWCMCQQCTVRSIAFACMFVFFPKMSLDNKWRCLPARARVFCTFVFSSLVPDLLKLLTTSLIRTENGLTCMSTTPTFCL